MVIEVDISLVTNEAQLLGRHGSQGPVYSTLPRRNTEADQGSPQGEIGDAEEKCLSPH